MRPVAGAPCSMAERSSSSSSSVHLATVNKPLPSPHHEPGYISDLPSLVEGDAVTDADPRAIDEPANAQHLSLPSSPSPSSSSFKLTPVSGPAGIAQSTSPPPDSDANGVHENIELQNLTHDEQTQVLPQALEHSRPELINRTSSPAAHLSSRSDQLLSDIQLAQSPGDHDDHLRGVGLPSLGETLPVVVAATAAQVGQLL